MRSSKSRSRNKSNRQRSLGNVVNRVFDSSGPEGKVRGTPQQIIDKYLMLARDAQLSNDRVAEQSFLQHAEHYTRLLGDAQREMAERHQQYQQNQRPGDDDRDNRDSGNRDNGNRDNGHRDSGHRDNGYRESGHRDNQNETHHMQEAGREQPSHRPAPLQTETAEQQPKGEPTENIRQPRSRNQSRPRVAKVSEETADQARLGLPDVVDSGEQPGSVQFPESGAPEESPLKAPRKRKASAKTAVRTPRKRKSDNAETTTPNPEQSSDAAE